MWIITFWCHHLTYRTNLMGFRILNLHIITVYSVIKVENFGFKTTFSYLRFLKPVWTIRGHNSISLKTIYTISLSLYENRWYIYRIFKPSSYHNSIKTQPSDHHAWKKFAKRTNTTELMAIWNCWAIKNTLYNWKIMRHISN